MLKGKLKIMLYILVKVNNQQSFMVVDFNSVVYFLTLTGVDRAIKREH